MIPAPCPVCVEVRRPGVRPGRRSVTLPRPEECCRDHRRLVVELAAAQEWNRQCREWSARERVEAERREREERDRVEGERARRRGGGLA